MTYKNNKDSIYKYNASLLKHRSNTTPILRCKDEEDDDGFDLPPNRSEVFVRQLRSLDMDYYMDGLIQNPGNYQDLIHKINHMQEDDNLRIWVNTVGGDPEIITTLLGAIQGSNGTTVVIGQGKAYSAGAMFFLQAPSVLVTDNMTMMIHAASYGAIGKENEVVSQYEFSKKWLEKLALNSYQGFLSPEEIEMVRMGRDYYFESDEIIERLDKRKTWQEAEVKRIEEDKTKKAKPRSKKKVSKPELTHEYIIEQYVPGELE